MENIIKKAVEGGYHHTLAIQGKQYTYLVCDPIFWQALGKSCGWREEPALKQNWEFIALSFHEINLTEGWDKAVKYLEDLIK